MSTISTEERREVARKLREVNPYRNQSYTIPYHRYTPAAEYLAELAGALGYSPKNDVSRLEFQSRLADLIETEPERTCRDIDYDTESITCSECGEITRDTLFWVDVDGGKTVKGHRPRFCSNCGARVVDE